MKNKFAVIRPRLWALPAIVLIIVSAALMAFTESSAAERKTVSFTFDDGPSEVTEEILEILKENNIKATFFVIGPQGEKTDERLKKIISEGHSIGLHSYSHKYSDIYASKENFLADIKKEMDWIKSVTGGEPELFRFPGGSTNSTVSTALMKELSEEMSGGYKIFDWNADGCDSIYCGISAEEIVKNVLSSVKDKNTVVVLLHDSSTQKEGPKALKMLIKEFTELGYDFCNLTELEDPVRFKRR